MPPKPELIPCKKCSEKTNKEVFHAAPACGPEYYAFDSTCAHGHCRVVSIDGIMKAHFIGDEQVEYAQKFIEVLKQMDAEKDK